MRFLKLSVLISCFVVSTFAKEIKLTENENKFSITSNTLTGFDFVNQLSEIQINKSKKMIFSLLSLTLMDMEKTQNMVTLLFQFLKS